MPWTQPSKVQLCVGIYRAPEAVPHFLFDYDPEKVTFVFVAPTVVRTDGMGRWFLRPAGRPAANGPLMRLTLAEGVDGDETTVRGRGLGVWADTTP